MVAQVDPRELEPGQWVDGWLIVRKIGSGTYSAVYEVEKDGKRFALKVACQRDQNSDPLQTEARAKREVVCLQHLNHRYIIRMWAHGWWPGPCSGFIYIVLDFVDGYTLGKWVERTHPTLHEAVVLFRKLFDALAYMHERGVSHRDLSLRNIMVTHKGEPVIIDFGAADYAAAEEVTDAPLPPGTPRNRSPEAMRFWNENRLNPKARYSFKATDDIFALGADLYDVLTDPAPERSSERHPLGGMMPPPSPFRLSQGRVPEELSAYCLMLIAREPEGRPATAKDAGRPLEGFERYEGPPWRGAPFHPVAAQLPPEPAAQLPGPVHAGLSQGVADAPPVREAVVVKGLRSGMRRRVFAGVLALTSLVVHPAEKPTSLSARLPLALPTQEEASPSMRQPENSPTPTNSGSSPSMAQRSSDWRVLSKAEACALLAFTLAWIEAGCAGVQARPDPEACPKGTRETMWEELGWDVGDQPLMVVDVTKGGIPRERRVKVEELDTVFQDGPVTGALSRALGKAPEGILLDGHLWTTGDRIYGRYRQARFPDGHAVPICIELADQRIVGIPKEAGSKPGAVRGQKEVQAEVVDRWR
ncbi:serine/threonine protein kinase [Hyalangium versicolor]|uniref:serine/threonine protein kinase n=1 Tax=Hyalangium versicolor TaxID=2861190 RepID=UPI001CCF5DE5|nr:serine/threonine protein kinase [Hyalangium versicolor]